MKKTAKRKKKRGRAEGATSSVAETKHPSIVSSLETPTIKTKAESSVEKTDTRNAEQRKTLLNKLITLTSLGSTILIVLPLLVGGEGSSISRFPIINAIVYFVSAAVFFWLALATFRTLIGFYKLRTLSDTQIIKNLRRQIFINSISIGMATFRILQKYGFVDWVTDWLISNYQTIGPKVASGIGWLFLAMVSGVIGNRADALFKRLFLERNQSV